MAVPPPKPLTWSRPWLLLLAGLALSVAGWLVSRGTAAPAYVPLGLLFPGTVLVLAAVSRQLRQEDWAWPGRIESSAIVSVGGLAAIAGYGAMREGWVSGHMFYAMLFVVALAGSLLILMPPLARRVALSLVVLFHFTGMAVCVTSIDPPNNTGLYLSKQLWSRVYRPYLSFLYMTNAYHFYSPDPGHPELLWFAVCFDDDSYTWVKLPERGNSPISMHYQRMLALPAHSYGAQARLPYTAAELAQASPELRPRRGSWEQIYVRRQRASENYQYRRQERPHSLPIPMVLDMDVVTQYREPHDLSKRTLASVARRIFQTAPPPRDEDGNVKEGVKVKSVKVYRVVHLVLSPQELAQGVSPLEKTKHWPYFMGEFDRFGNLVDEMDPYLYWYLPIAWVPSSYPGNTPGVPSINARTGSPKDGFLLDCLEMHAAGRRAPTQEKK